MVTLPNKLSALLDHALYDLEWVLDQPDKYVYDSRYWHKPIDGICHVCLGGAVIAKTFNKSPSLHIKDTDFDLQTCIKLNALSAARSNNWLYAFFLINNWDVGTIPDKYRVLAYELGEIYRYFDDFSGKMIERKQYFKQMKHIISLLKKHKL